MAQWLRMCTSSAGGTDPIPHQETKLFHSAAQQQQIPSLHLKIIEGKFCVTTFHHNLKPKHTHVEILKRLVATPM